MKRIFFPLAAILLVGLHSQCSKAERAPIGKGTPAAESNAPASVPALPVPNTQSPAPMDGGNPPPPSAVAEFTPRARTKTQLEEGVVTFMAYNLKNYLTMERGNHEQPKPEREIKALLGMITDVKPDMLGVCEIGTKEDLLDLQKRLKEAGLDLPHAELCDGPDAYRNLGLLSRFPIVARDHQTNLSYPMADQTFPFNRGILDATVEPAPGYRLRLLGTHLKSKRPVNDGDEAEMRRNESRLLRKHIESILATEPNTNLLVYGDLNDTKNTDVILDLKGKEGRPDHLYDLWLRDRFGFTWTHYWITADQYARIDYVLYARSLAPEILRRDSYIHHAPEWFTASDHRPLVVRISPRDVKPR